METSSHLKLKLKCCSGKERDKKHGINKKIQEMEMFKKNKSVFTHMSIQTQKEWNTKGNILKRVLAVLLVHIQ